MPVRWLLRRSVHREAPSGAPITVAGKKLRLKGVSEMSSPAFYKTDMQISVDGGAFVSYGRVTYSKQLPDDK